MNVYCAARRFETFLMRFIINRLMTSEQIYGTVFFAGDHKAANLNFPGYLLASDSGGNSFSVGPL